MSEPEGPIVLAYNFCNENLLPICHIGSSEQNYMRYLMYKGSSANCNRETRSSRSFEKLVVAQLFGQVIPCLLWNPIFIIMFMRACHWSLS
jgi:hypothetical protein